MQRHFENIGEKCYQMHKAFILGSNEFDGTSCNIDLYPDIANDFWIPQPKTLTNTYGGIKDDFVSPEDEEFVIDKILEGLKINLKQQANSLSTSNSVDVEVPVYNPEVTAFKLNEILETGCIEHAFVQDYYLLNNFAHSNYRSNVIYKPASRNDRYEIELKKTCE